MSTAKYISPMSGHPIMARACDGKTSHVVAAGPFHAACQGPLQPPLASGRMVVHTDFTFLADHNTNRRWCHWESGPLHDRSGNGSAVIAQNRRVWWWSSVPTEGFIRCWCRLPTPAFSGLRDDNCRTRATDESASLRWSWPTGGDMAVVILPSPIQ